MPDSTRENARHTEDLPLHGLKVVEVAQGVAGPFCGRLLAAYGASVIKVERPPDGDWSRSVGPFLSGDNRLECSALYLYNNMGKKSVLVDWETESGMDDLVSLVSKSDVFIGDWDRNYRETRGLSAKWFGPKNPELIELCVTPFGLTGPYSRWRSAPIVQLALGGFLNLTGEPFREPLMLPGYQPDYLTGLNAHNALQIALWERDSDGVGQFIEMSMIETLSNLHQVPLDMDGMVRMRNGHRQSNLRKKAFPPGLTILPAEDGYMNFSGGNPAVWEQLCLMLDREDLIPRAESTDKADILELADEVDELLITWMKGRSRKEVFLEASGDWMLPVGPVSRLQEVLSDPQYNHRNLFQDIHHPVVGQATYPILPFVTPDTVHVLDRAPLFGEHTGQVLGR